MPLAIRKTHHLNRGRVSIPGATYFITTVTQKRRTDLTRHGLPQQLTESLRTLHKDRLIKLHCANTMPDHHHMLFTLGTVCELSHVISKFKNLTRKHLFLHSLYWQRNYHDHRIRQDANTNAFAQYTFLNPYRKNLLPSDQLWPHWVCSSNYKPDFQELLNPDGTPPPAWFRTAPTAQQLIDADIAPVGRGLHCPSRTAPIQPYAGRGINLAPTIAPVGRGLHCPPALPTIPKP